MMYQPAQWLHNLAKTPPAPFIPWRHCIRLILITTVPMSVGFLTNNIALAMIMTLGGLLTATNVQTDPYAARFRKIAISAPIGMSGYVIGSLAVGHGGWTIASIVAVAFFSGLISNIGAAVSAGALQMLVMSIVASHAPPSGPIWQMPLFFGLGAAYAACLLGVEVLFSPLRPERKSIQSLLESLAHLARISAQADVPQTTLEAAIRDVTNAQSKAYSVLMEIQHHTDGRSVAGDWCSKILAITDRISARLLTPSENKQVRKQAADELAQLAAMIMHPNQLQSLPRTDDAKSQLLYNIARLPDAISSSVRSEHVRAPGKSFTSRRFKIRFSLSQLIARFQLGREAIRSAIQLALCMLIALIVERVMPGERSYWVPLSVAVILKPDFGSVFVRAILRSVGTFIGVLIGAMIFLLVPKGLYLIPVIAVLSALIPWASLKSYAIMCTFLTPLVLILMDLIMPGATVDYGMQRLVDTATGSAIVLIFGYLIWPKTIKLSIKNGFQNASQAIANYMRSVASSVPDEGGRGADKLLSQSMAKRREAYMSLSDLRVHLQRAMSEPPPVSVEAMSWLPAVTATERICDHITTFALMCDQQGQITAPKAALMLADLIEGAVTNTVDADSKDADFLKLLGHADSGTPQAVLMDIYQNIINIQQNYSKT